MPRLSKVFLLAAFAVLTVAAAVTEHRVAVDELSVEEASRDRRATRWTVQPTRSEVRYLTQRTEFLSKLYRGFISFERWFYDVLSTSSKFEVASFLAAGVFLTFIVLYIPLRLLFDAPLLVRRKRALVEHDAGHNINQLVDFPLEFQLPEWEQAMSRWAILSRPANKRFRCCILPASARCYPFAEQLPSACPQQEHRDVTVDRDFRLAFQ